MADRLARFPVDEGVSDVAALVAPLSAIEASRLGSNAEISLPPSVSAKARRCLEAPVDELVQAGLVPSSEVLAWTLPLLMARVRAEAVSDPTLRRLYEAIYMSFRRRRSLLLLDLESQVRLNELPWVAAIESWVGSDEAAQTATHKTLTETTVLAIENFPHSIFPNRLIKELRALAQAADLNIPLVDELAADIFMGAFSGSFLRAAQSAGDLLRNSVYERYYGLDYGRVLAINDLHKDRFGTATSAGFAALCQELAGESTELGRSVARNGAVIEPDSHHP